VVYVVLSLRTLVVGELQFLEVLSDDGLLLEVRRREAHAGHVQLLPDESEGLLPRLIDH
jgi:hypothetical protein